MVTLRTRLGDAAPTQHAYLGLLGVIGALRCTVGVVGLARPELLGRFSGLDRVTAQRTAWLTRMAAARDLALGAGQLATAVRGPSGASARSNARLWAFTGALADAGDTAALCTAAAAGHIAPVRGCLLSLSSAAAVIGALPILRAPAGLPGE